MYHDRETFIFRTVGYITITLMAIGCVLPFLLIISGSFSSESSIYVYGYRLIPKMISFEAYSIILKAPEKILRSYAVTASVTLIGSIVGLFLTSMTAYVLFRKDFKYRNYLAFYFYFTTLFSGGLTPYYIMMVKTLRMKDNYLAIILPGLMAVWYILIMRNFLNSIPNELIESGKIDGAGDFLLFIRIVFPLSTPGLATIGLFMALAYWNEWFGAMLFLEDSRKYPLQYFLYRLLNSGRFVDNVVAASKVSGSELPRETMKMAMSVVATGPIILVYPFIQKYFVKGLTIGAVKG